MLDAEANDVADLAVIHTISPLLPDRSRLGSGIEGGDSHLCRFAEQVAQDHAGGFQKRAAQSVADPQYVEIRRRATPLPRWPPPRTWRCPPVPTRCTASRSDSDRKVGCQQGSGGDDPAGFDSQPLLVIPSCSGLRKCGRAVGQDQIGFALRIDLLDSLGNGGFGVRPRCEHTVGLEPDHLVPAYQVIQGDLWRHASTSFVWSAPARSAGRHLPIDVGSW